MNPYRALISENRNYRLLWFGQIVSQLGDWFNSVAVYALLLELTGSATSVVCPARAPTPWTRRVVW